jgi:hypothetical protein
MIDVFEDCERTVAELNYLRILLYLCPWMFLLFNKSLIIFFFLISQNHLSLIIKQKKIDVGFKLLNLLDYTISCIFLYFMPLYISGERLIKRKKERKKNIYLVT